MKTAIEKGEVVELESIDKFVDGAAVKKAGKLTYEICRKVLDDIVVVPEGAVCTTIIDMYNKSAIVVEPAGALSVAAMRFYADKIKGKCVGCIISGSNNDITRTEEIREKSMLYEGLKHYFIVSFPPAFGCIPLLYQGQSRPEGRPGALPVHQEDQQGGRACPHRYRSGDQGGLRGPRAQDGRKQGGIRIHQ